MKSRGRGLRKAFFLGGGVNSCFQFAAVKSYIAAELHRIWRSGRERINILKVFKYLIDNSRDVM